jgi:hypothetical protein
MVRRHGEQVDWRKADVNLMTSYASGGGKIHLSLQCRVIFLCNTFCMYAMLNRIINSPKMRAQKAAQSSWSSRSSFIPQRSKEQLKIEMLKESLRQRGEAMRQRDEYYSQALAQKQAMLQVS